MSHAHHFLERLDRVTREQTEFALALYRDHEAVAYVLGYLNLAESAARVALAVDESPNGPVVVVTRDGKFVTCLGAGMRHDHPLVPRRRLEALLAKVEEKRARRELVQRELRPDEEEGDVLQRILTRGSRMSREDFLVVSAFEPLLGLGPFLAMLDVGSEAVKARALMSIHASNAVANGATKKALERLYRMEWATAHLTLLSGAADRRALDDFLETTRHVRASAGIPCSMQGGSTFFLRAAWMVARFGKAFIPTYKVAFAQAKDWMSVLDAGMGLAAIALRHASTAAEVKRAFEGYDPPVRAPMTTDDARRNCARAMLEAIDNPEERMESTLKVGRHFAVTYGEGLREGHPQRFKTMEEVPDDIARTAALAFDGDVFDGRIQGFTVSTLPTAARAAAEDFYFPRDVVRAWFGAWQQDETLARLKRWVPRDSKLTPARAEATPGRNDPCSCGSGRKWKKCHGAPGGVP